MGDDRRIHLRFMAGSVKNGSWLMRNGAGVRESRALFAGTPLCFGQTVFENTDPRTDKRIAARSVENLANSRAYER